MTDTKTVAVGCHFFDPATGTGKNPNSRCGGEAVGFVRIKNTGRLCPLCEPCKTTFVSANKAMSDDVKKTIPGGGEYEEVALEVGSAEFAAQPPKTA